MAAWNVERICLGEHFGAEVVERSEERFEACLLQALLNPCRPEIRFS
jgi:hypothetical protein